MNRRDPKLKLILSLLLALGAVSFATTRIRSIRTAWRVSDSRPGNSETIRLRVRSLCEKSYRYRAAGRYDEAERLYLRALAIFEREAGPDSYDMAVNLNNLAALYQAEGKVSEAERRLVRALKIKEKLLGPDHPEVATTLNNLALLRKS